MLRIVVLVKQVPDTKNIVGEAMNPDGTINRAALPAIFNPEDLHALEMALEVRDRIPAEIHVLTMGLLSASEILREALFRGADEAYLLNDKRFAGADTIATSYALSKAIEKIGRVDLVFAGRQAIDGDTAQVGPQVAKYLNFPQITYAQELLEVNKKEILIRRQIENGYELIKGKLPLLVTVLDTAPSLRPRYLERIISKRKATHPIWTLEDIGAQAQYCGMSGSPTNVHKVSSVSLHGRGREAEFIPLTPEGFDKLLKKLINSHIVEEYSYE